MHHHELCYISSSLIINIVNLFFPHFIFSTHQHQVCVPISSSLCTTWWTLFPFFLFFSPCHHQQCCLISSSLWPSWSLFSIFPLLSLPSLDFFLFYLLSSSTSTFSPCHHQLLFQFHFSFFPAIINFVPISSFLLSPPSSTLQCFSNFHFLSSPSSSRLLFPFQSSQASPIINWLLFLVIHPLSSPSSLAQILGVQVRGKISRTWEKTKPENLWPENNFLQLKANQTQKTILLQIDCDPDANVLQNSLKLSMRIVSAG